MVESTYDCLTLGGGKKLVARGEGGDVIVGKADILTRVGEEH